MIRRTDAALLGGLVVMGALAVGVGIVPRLSRRAWLDDEVARLGAELVRPTGGPEVVARLSDDLAQLRSFGEGRMTPIPRDADIAGLVSALSDTLTRHGIDRRDILTRDAKRMEGASGLPVSITVQAPFGKVYDTIADIEAFPRLVRIERLKLSRSNPPGGRGTVDRSGVIRAEIAVTAFFYPALAEAAVQKGEP
ncbi:MAG TPA: hypothetical protein DEB06_06430 [Phycisphaerales bacterium]|nr:hypothetical protein [Phycisphaerales bacterium]